MHPDDHVCLCFRVPLRKIRTYMKREDPPVASLISECLGAGTGCQWCVPFLNELHRQHAERDGRGPNGEPDLNISPQRYVADRAAYRRTGERPAPSSNHFDDDQTTPDPADRA
jgi:bacterioferritin-associated ferredoxin